MNSVHHFELVALPGLLGVFDLSCFVFETGPCNPGSH